MDTLKRILYTVPCFLLLITGLVDGSLAKEIFWESVPVRSARQKAAGLSGGEGFQQVMCIAYAPSNPSVVYFGVDTSQVWKSTDGGFTWCSKNNGFVANGARSIIVDPKNPEIVFAAGFLGQPYERSQKANKRLQGIYRTTDGGEHWDLVKETDFFKQASKGCLFAFDSASFSSSKTWTIFAGSYSEGLIYSKDGGETWQSTGFQKREIIDMEENPGKLGELYIATDGGLYRYLNGIIEKIGGGLPDWPRSIAVSAQNSNVMYAAVGKKGVYKSIDGGVNFFSANEGLPLYTEFVDVNVSPCNSSIVYIKSHKSRFKKPLFSHDGGRSWNTPETTDLKNLSLDDGGFWFSSPFAPHPTEAMTALTVSNGRARILKTLDGGKNWGYSGSGFTGGRMRNIAFSKDGKMVFCITDHGIWLTEDGGDTFRGLKVKKILGKKSSYSGDIRGNTIVASVGKWKKKGLAVSHDLGKKWKTIDGLIDIYRFIAIHPKLDNVIYAGPYRSDDKGDTWTKLSQTVRAMYIRNGDIVYAISSSAERSCLILKSVDQGKSWLKLYPVCPFPAKSVNDITVAPNDSDRIYLATSDGLWIYDGSKWVVRNSNHGLEEDFFGLCYIGSVSVDPRNPNIIYVGRMAPGCGQSNGIFRSTDRGLDWENITNNLGPALTVWAIEISTADSSVYIGTSLGTFRLTKASIIK